MNQEENNLVYSLPRVEGEEIQMAIRKFHARYYADVRVWYLAKEQNAMRPTRKGICLTLEQLRDFCHGIAELNKAVEQFRKEKKA